MSQLAKMRKPVRPPRLPPRTGQDHLPTRFSCKGPSGWDCRRPDLAVRARAVLEHSLLAESVPMSSELASRADLPVVSAAAEVEGREPARCKEPAELSFSAAGREAAEVVLGAEGAAQVAEAAGCFARP